MMTYLIDTENTGYSWVRLLPSLLSGDRLCLYYSQSSAPIPMSILDIILSCGVKLEVTHCTLGPNAMDFQLVTDLGGKIAVSPGDAYVIVSKDGGYDAAVHFWRIRNVSIKRLAIPAMSQKEMQKFLERHFPDVLLTGTPKPVERVTAQELHEMRRGCYIKEAEDAAASQQCQIELLAAGASRIQAEKICEIIIAEKNTPSKLRRKRIYASVLEAFGQSPGIEVYQKYVKPIAFKFLEMR